LTGITYWYISMLVGKRKTKNEMTEFGQVLNRLMVLHGVYDWKTLLARLEEHGHRVPQSGLSQYVYGTRRPRNPRAFTDAVARVLELTAAEERELMLALIYGDRPEEPRGANAPPHDAAKLTEENRQRINEVQREYEKRLKKRHEPEPEERRDAGNRRA
jgi:hypothetical protein